MNGLEQMLSSESTQLDLFSYAERSTVSLCYKEVQMVPCSKRMRAREKLRNLSLRPALTPLSIQKFIQALQKMHFKTASPLFFPHSRYQNEMIISEATSGNFLELLWSIG